MFAHVQRLMPSALRMAHGFPRLRMIRSDILWLTCGFDVPVYRFRMDEMLRSSEFGGWSAVPVIVVQSVRRYRVKKERVMTNEEEFICKIAKVAPSDATTLEEFRQRLKHLVDCGCKSSELVEFPEILQLTEADIDRRIERLRSCGQSSVSMPLLKFAKPESSDTSLRSSLARYLKQQNGRLNKVDEIQSALRCTDDEMQDILKRNPRLIGIRKRRFIVEKIACLLKCGAIIEDIRANTNLLNNKTLEDVESRANRLVALGYNDPLPIGVIGRDDDDFEVIVARLERRRSLQPTSRYVESREIIARIPEYANKKLHVVKPKVDLLLSHGYVGEEIIEFPSILELGLEAIHDAIVYLQSYHLGAVNLETCHRYATKKSITTRTTSSRKILSKVLGCSSTELPTLPKDFHVAGCTEAMLHANYDFLRSVGFTSADLRRLPIVLAQRTEVLRRHWDLIQTDEGLAGHFESWKEDKMRLLHLLDFSVERESNFSHAVAAADVAEDERKRADDSETETVEYEAALERETDESFEGVAVDRRTEQPDSDMEFDRDAECDVSLEHNATEHNGCLELNSVEIYDAYVAVDPGVEFNRGTSDAELDLGAEYDPDAQLEPRVEYDLDLDTEPGTEHVGGGAENRREVESHSDASTSSDEETAVGIENDMVELFPSSSARWTSHDRFDKNR